LRQVVAERSEDHIVNPVRLPSISYPGIARNVRVLRAILESAFGPAVKAVPEADGALHERACIPRAIGQSAGYRTRNNTARPGRDLSVTTCVVEPGCAITNWLAGYRVNAPRTIGVLDSTVAVKVDMLGFQFQRADSVKVFDQAKRAVGIDGGIRQAARSIASDSAAAEALQTKSKVLGEEPARAGTDAASIFGIVVSVRGIRARSRAGAAHGG